MRKTNTIKTSYLKEDIQTLMNVIERSGLTDGQIYLLMYYLHEGLCRELNSGKQTLRFKSSKVNENLSEKEQQEYLFIQKTVTSFESICEVLGGILYDVITSDESLTDNQVEIVDEHFDKNLPWKDGTSSVTRRVMKLLRGFGHKKEK